MQTTLVRRWLSSTGIQLLASALLAFLPALSLAQVCAPPALLLTAIPPGGIVNDYYDGSAQATLSPGASTLVLGARDPRGYTTTMVIGDLLMVMQMQDGSIDSSNNSNYGSGSGSGNGSTSVGSAGLYEFVRVTNVAGSAITFTPKLSNQYFYQDAGASTAQKRYQVVRTLQFASATTTVAVIAPYWNGKTGGVVAMDVRDTLNLQNQAVEGESAAIFVAGKGFRGGFGRNLTTTGGTNIEQDYATTSANDWHAGKGEGFIGTPRFVAEKGAALGTATWGTRGTNMPTGLAGPVGAQEGYPGGSYARGAPGNAGGGGVDGATPEATNQKNAGGGGGGNYGPGGIGGRPWSRPLLDTGGRGGAGYAGTLAFNRVFMGGGGGAGGTNNSSGDAADPPANPNLSHRCTVGVGACSSGAAGGGVVVVRARNITGSGTIDARGAHGYNVGNDAAGGGGAGGSVILETPNGGGARIDVTGGDGGNAFANNATWAAGRHGPGGAGGGGFVAYAPNSMAVIAIVGGGTPGQTMSNSAAAGGPAVEYYGSEGFNGGITTFQSPNVPGAPQAALCDPILSLTKSDGVTSLISPNTVTYTFRVTNTGLSDSSGTVVIADRLPSGLTVVPGPLTLSGVHAGQWTCNAANATDITCTSTSVVTASGGTKSFAIAVALLAPDGTSIVNKAQLSGGGDPLKTTTATPVTAATCTGANAPLAGCAIDTDTVVAPNLTLTKTNGVDELARGTSVTYTLGITNEGSTATVGTFTVADLLPTGMTYSGSSPFSMNNFTCTVSGQGITCNRTTSLAAGASTSITFTVSISDTPPGAVINRAKVGGGSDPSPNKSTRPTTATAALCADPAPPATSTSDADNGCATDADAIRYVSLSLSKSDGAVFVSQGAFTNYVFTVENIGTIASTGQLNFRDVLPSPSAATTSFVATASPYAPLGTNGTDWSCTRNSNTETFCISSTSIPAGGSSSFILQARVTTTAVVGTQVVNLSRIGGGGDVSTGMVNSPTVANVKTCIGDGSPAGCAIDLNTVQTAAPTVRMTKAHTPAGPKSVGEAFTFTLVITNSGSGAGSQRSVTMVDYLPLGLTVNAITVTPATTFTCGTSTRAVSCNNTLASFAANSSVTVAVGVTVAAAATNTLVNSAKVAASGPVPDPQNSTLPTTTTAAICTGTNIPSFGCAADTVTLNADLQIVKSQRTGTGSFQTSALGAANGGTVQFQISVANVAGSANMTTVTFSDNVPGNFSTPTFISATPAGGATGCTASFAGNLLSGLASGMPSGSTCTVIVQAIASLNTAGVTNTAAVTVPTGIADSNTANNTSSVSTAIGWSLVNVTKTNGAGTLTAGTTTSYTITVANFGPSAADGSIIVDPAATGLSCTTVTCSATAANMCPPTPTVGALQSTGLAISPTFAINTTATFVVTCDVTATGQ